jgi:antigen flippase
MNTSQAFVGTPTNMEVSSGSYRQILKSTCLIGGSAVISIVLRVIRTKLTAVVVGRSGVGLLGTYTSLAETVSSLVGLGLDTGGVKQIAESAATRDHDRIARTIISLRRSLWLLGSAGMIALIMSCTVVSNLTFKTPAYSADIALLSLMVLLISLTNGEIALIQGMRRIGDLARLNVLTALFGTLVSVPILYVWGIRGIVPFLIIGSGATFLAACWYARNIPIRSVALSRSDIQVELRPMLTLGLAIMTTAVMTRATAYFVNVVVSRRLGLEAVGLYQVAATLSAIYVSFILDAMVKDYLPRLSALSRDASACNRLINEQTEIGVLVAAPGLVATLTFAPTIIEYFYSPDFVPAYGILRWFVLGIFIQVATWPLGLIFQAMGRAHIIVTTTLLSSLVQIGLLYIAIERYGLHAVGLAFLGMRLFLAMLTYHIARALTGFRWSPTNVRIAMLIVVVLGLVFMLGVTLDNVTFTILGGGLTMAVGCYSVSRVLRAGGPGAVTFALVRLRSR